MMTQEAVHPFEKAGMGKAPFRLAGEDAVHRARRLGGGFGFCDACGTQITRPYYVESADGKVSMVGSNCIGKIADRDPMLARQVHTAKLVEDRKVRAKRKATRAESDKARISAAKFSACDPDVREALAARPHPTFKGSDCSALTYVEWMFENAGTTGQLKAAAIVEACDHDLNHPGAR